MRVVGIQSIQKAHGGLESQLDTGLEVVRRSPGNAVPTVEMDALVKSRRWPAEIPSVSGVYQIRCVRIGKIYVGSAVNLRARRVLHRRALAINQHHHPHLQAAWNAHGEIGDFCRRHRLNMTAMRQLFGGQSRLNSHKGWTHVNSVRQRELIKTHEGFSNPHGRRVGPIRNLAAFCRENGREDTHMVAVASGRIVSHRGWTHVRGRKTHCRSGKRPSHKGWTWKHDADLAFDELHLT